MWQLMRQYIALLPDYCRFNFAKQNCLSRKLWITSKYKGFCPKCLALNKVYNCLALNNPEMATVFDNNPAIL
jgi:hypothetical protein